MRRSTYLAAVAVAMATIGACGQGSLGASPNGRGSTPTSTVTNVDPWILPSPRLTPGAVQSTSVADVCPHVNPEFEKNRPGTTVKNHVYAAYGITSHPTGRYEIDHLVPLELGGANTEDNLWPEPNDHPRGHPNGNSKDDLEDELHRLVCAGKLSLTAAQEKIRTNWVAAYREFVR